MLMDVSTSASDCCRRRGLDERNTRDRGAVFVYVLICLSVLLGLSAGAGALSVVEQRASAESRGQMAAYYLADSGAQIGNFKIRAAGGVLGATTFTENLAYGTVSVAVDPLAPSLYSVRSTATAGGLTEIVHVHLQCAAGLALTGAVQINVHESVLVATSDLPVSVRDATAITGADHDAAGAALADQSDATFGIALSPVPGPVDVNPTVETMSGAILAGAPTATTNNAAGQADVLDSLVQLARNSADVTVTGGAVLGTAATGSYGTPADPVLAYVQLGANQTLTLREDFLGYGTLVVESSYQSSVEALQMGENSGWRGLVIVYFSGPAEVSGAQLIRLADSALIVGGLAIQMRGAGSNLTGAGQIIAMTAGSAAVRYSSALVAAAEGIAAVVGTSARVISYQRISL
jgi:hypothetical protein